MLDGFLNAHLLSETDEKAYRAFLRGWALPNLATVEGFREALSAAGFVDVACHNLRTEILHCKPPDLLLVYPPARSPCLHSSHPNRSQSHR